MGAEFPQGDRVRLPTRCRGSDVDEERDGCSLTAEHGRSPIFSAPTGFTNAVHTVLPKFLYSAETPPEIIARLNGEFLRSSGERAAQLLEPLYRCDLQQAARAVKVPVRAINSDAPPTALEGNRRWFADYDIEVMRGVGHYRMLEQPAAFNEALRRVLASY